MIYWLIKIFQSLLNLFPVAWRNSFFTRILRLMLVIKPGLRQAATTNLNFMLPSSSKEEKQELVNACCASWGRTMADVFRQKNLDRDWFEEHVEFADIELLREFKDRYAQQGCLIQTPHYGSFELLLKVYEYNFGGVSFIARKIKPEGFDRWWTEQRKSSSHQLIRRKGAIRQVLKHLEQGKDVALLPDHNLVRNQALFIDWFGEYAANTPLIALAAIRHRSPVISAAIESLPNDRYRINSILRHPEDIYAKDLVQNARSIYYYADLFAKDLQTLIKLSPEHWLWFHKRWKTSIKIGEGEKIYV